MELKLLDAILTAFDKHHTAKDITGDNIPETFCNLAVDYVLATFGYFAMRNPDKTPMVADQMVDFMSRRPDDWEAVTMGQAQDLANAGRVVVAGMSSAQLSLVTGSQVKHGHVVVVRPGTPEWSAKYSASAPKVSHVGATSYIGRGVEWAFPGALAPNFWILKTNG